ncbi:MAG: DNA methyltransferase, partial [Candidatus Altarchaeaceae archaeon]
MKIYENLSLGKLVTFTPNKNIPIYNWFYYKEGFSRDFVMLFLDKFNVNPGNVVLDPFVGVGTTLLACKEKGINAIGFDVHPVALFASKVKIENYDIEKLKKFSSEIFLKKFQKKSTSKIPKFIRKAFSKYVLEDILFFKEVINEIPDEKYRNFFTLALMNSALKSSYIFKDGGKIKIIKRDVAPLRDMFKRKVKRMIKEFENFKEKFKECEIYVDFCDARNLKIENETIDAVITSPPYLNKIEYSEIYGIEEYLFFKKENLPLIRSFIGMKEKENFEIDKFLNYELPFQAKAYFDDMYKVIKEIFRVCKKNAKLAIVVGDAVFIDKVIDVPKIIAEISEKIGFKVNEII